MRSAVLDGPAARGNTIGQRFSPLAYAVYTWIQNMEDRPLTRVGGMTDSKTRNVDDALVLSYTKDISNQGIYYFNKVADDVETFGQLQKLMGRRLLEGVPARRPSKQTMAKRRLQEANVRWNCLREPSDSPSLSTDSDCSSTSSSSQSAKKVSFGPVQVTLYFRDL
ncbi:hypothetical protein DIPPA_09752 [Diplonema papillatum]|nr:hypothetical protein DIPPA_09752 [Diplonema papillatum]